MAETNDVIVVGGGPAGEHAVGRCVDAGLSTAVVERELVGGECSYWACMPSKTLLRPGQVLAAARRVPGAAAAVTGDLDTPDALVASLKRQRWDIAIADYTMPGFTGTAALTLVRQHDADLPFIFLSGTIGEDAAKHRLRPDDLLEKFEELRRSDQLDETAARLLRDVYV